MSIWECKRTYPRHKYVLSKPCWHLFQNLTLSDLVKVDIDGNLLSGKYKPHPGGLIHREIYRLRPDVNAIVHTHAEATVAMSLLGTTIGAYTQLGESFVDDQAVFIGSVRTQAQAYFMAKTLGQKSLLIAKNHGMFSTGSNIQKALWDFIVADQASRVHLGAHKLDIKDNTEESRENFEKCKNEVRNSKWEDFWKQHMCLDPGIKPGNDTPECQMKLFKV